jgi:hypothetical protein
MRHSAATMDDPLADVPVVAVAAVSFGSTVNGEFLPNSPWFDPQSMDPLS